MANRRLPVVGAIAPSAGTFVVYRGASALNGAPIVALLTGVAHASLNTKTGHMAQLWILPAAEAPHVAQQTGGDAAVCGDCPLRPATAAKGAARCYVRTFQGPRATWERNRRAPVDLDGAARALASSGLALRLGAYGDPAALPRVVVELLAAAASSVTGYTHQWRDARRAWLASASMASVESVEDAEAARAKGWRTFRVLSQGASLGAGEVLCPNESHGVQCASCRLCGGARENVKSVAIHVH